MISEIVPTFSRKPLFSHSAAAGSVVAIAVLGVLAWMQNMYSAPIPDGFAYMAMAAAVGLLVPVGLLFFNWTATIWVGAVSTRAPLDLRWPRLALAFGLAGQLATSVIPVGLQLENTTAAQQDTIMVVVGFTLAAFAALHYWLPKITGPPGGGGAGEGRHRRWSSAERSSTRSRCSSRASRASPWTSSATTRTTASRRST